MANELQTIGKRKANERQTTGVSRMTKTMGFSGNYLIKHSDRDRIRAHSSALIKPIVVSNSRSLECIVFCMHFMPKVIPNSFFVIPIAARNKSFAESLLRQRFSADVLPNQPLRAIPFQNPNVSHLWLCLAMVLNFFHLSLTSERCLSQIQIEGKDRKRRGVWKIVKQ